MVAEVLQLESLPGYTTGGTVHIIINNQIGFTTDPEDARSSTYCTDVAKTIQAPIFHVNGEDVEMCAFIIQLAVEYRQTFGKDVVVDMWCYRKHGHNESDEPAFTQPAMYEVIRKKRPISAVYSEQLKAEGVISDQEVQKMQKEMEEVLDEAQAHAKETPVLPNQEGFRKHWVGYGKPFNFKPVPTAVPEEKLKLYAERLAELPEGFKPHPKVARLTKGRRDAAIEGKPLDWGTVEALAYASLLDEGIPVRMTGQDSRRGTFSHRHAVLTDVETEEEYTPLDHIRERQPKFCIYDSPLAEASVVGFEYGYSLGDPNMLILWEAQFGDFANGAQVIIDQFIASAETKWDRSSGLVMLLPHGYEGQGPEHSSARLERFLQLCAQDNIQVANFTTPAQFFHAMRRQMKRSFRKPLIIMSPKKLLRHPDAVSGLAELSNGSFQEIIDDASVKDPKSIRRIMMCTGKVYFDLIARRAEVESTDTAIIRIEQLYPLHVELLREIFGRYPNAEDFIWVQEEPKNMGAWMHMHEWLDEYLDVRLRYIGRAASATPAVGSHTAHERELREFLEAAFTVHSTAVVAG
jgi:2-oxoglutarate dehydrogenase E1 component